MLLGVGCLLFEIITQLKAYILVFWSMTPYSLVDRFISLYYHNFQRENIRARTVFEDYAVINFEKYQIVSNDLNINQSYGHLKCWTDRQMSKSDLSVRCDFN